MNMNLDIVNSALFAVGSKEFFTKEDKDKPEKKVLYNQCKSFYLEAYLEALAAVPWCSASTFMRLSRVRENNGYSQYGFIYELPHDFSRIISLNGYHHNAGDKCYIDNGRLITDAPNAVLDYVSNGKVLQPERKFVPEPMYVIENNEIFIQERNENYISPDDDFDEFKTREHLEIHLWVYVEALLAVKLARKFNKPNLYDLIKFAKYKKQDAVETTIACSGKGTGAKYKTFSVGNCYPYDDYMLEEGDFYEHGF